MGGRLVKSDSRSHSGSHQRSALIQNPSLSRVWQNICVTTSNLDQKCSARVGFDSAGLEVPKSFLGKKKKGASTG